MSKKVKLIASMLTVIIGVSALCGCESKSNNSKKGDDKEIVVWSNLMDNEVEAQTQQKDRIWESRICTPAPMCLTCSLRQGSLPIEGALFHDRR